MRPVEEALTSFVTRRSGGRAPVAKQMSLFSDRPSATASGPQRECLVCESTDSIQVHHLDGHRKNNSEDKLADLCARCHRELHRSRGWFKTKEELRQLRFAVQMGRIIERTLERDSVRDGAVRKSPDADS